MNVSYPQLAVVVLLTCLVGGLFVGISTSGTAYGPYNYDWDGSSELRTLAERDAETTIGLSTDRYENLPANGTAAVTIDPGEMYGPRERSVVASFVSRGGTLIVASDTAESNALLAGVGSTIRINGTPVRDDQNNYRAAAFPAATNVSERAPVRGVDAMTLNHGTVLNPGEARPLVNTSAVAYLDVNENGELDGSDEIGPYPVAAIEEVRNGAVIVVSDGSVFTNAMLDRDGNRRFVKNVAADHDRVLLDYSQQGSLPPLSYVLLVVRTRPPLQILTGVVGLALVAGWGRGVGSRLWDRVTDLRRGQSSRVVDEPVDSETLASYLGREHPDWDDERIERVTKAIIREHRQGTDDE